MWELVEQTVGSKVTLIRRNERGMHVETGEGQFLNVVPLEDRAKIRMHLG